MERWSQNGPQWLDTQCRHPTTAAGAAFGSFLDIWNPRLLNQHPHFKHALLLIVLIRRHREFSTLSTLIKVLSRSLSFSRISAQLSPWVTCVERGGCYSWRHIVCIGWKEPSFTVSSKLPGRVRQEKHQQQWAQSRWGTGPQHSCELWENVACILKQAGVKTWLGYESSAKGQICCE